MMPTRGMDQIVFVCIAFGLLCALVAFAKIVLSDSVAIFIAGLGVGALGAFILQHPALRQSRGG